MLPKQQFNLLFAVLSFFFSLPLLGSFGFFFFLKVVCIYGMEDELNSVVTMCTEWFSNSTI
ncbi:hypothetical protein P691DRAFT_813493 [Macrolepiota fuliginosa MF-IS2]|uniref:Uncharacterized protein n=1 Tax=Macrolepiota fuliginosa MF-IS2 TaxID=1400762 RepID=A0A9P5XG10_9AGAR|nr:hypothetical protein P691DRAFT_813493 [Macrolepiota fuliginosa MF-IS2]